MKNLNMKDTLLMKIWKGMSKLTDEDIVVCKKAIDTYGAAHQQLKAVEELSELIQAIMRALEGDKHNVEEEIADVEIMLTQLKIMYNMAKVDEWRKLKINKLKGVVW